MFLTMPVILTVLYPNAAFRNHRTTETVSITKITASSDSHPVEFSSTSGLLPRPKPQRWPSFPQCTTCVWKPSRALFGVRLEMESWVEAGVWIQGAYALTGSETHLKQEFWRDTRFERLRSFVCEDLWRLVWDC